MFKNTKNFVKELSRIVGESNYKGLLEKETIAVADILLRCKIFNEENHVKLVFYYKDTSNNLKQFYCWLTVKGLVLLPFSLSFVIRLQVDV